MERLGRNSFLDIIKAFCILFVIITHAQISGSFRLCALFPFWINMAVPLFMIISGYVYASSFERNGISEIGGAYSLRFIMPKFIRYTVPFVMAFVVEVLGELYKAPSSFYIKQMALIFFKGGKGPGSYYYPLMIEFLLFYPVLYFIIKKNVLQGLALCFIVNVGFEFFSCVWACNNAFYRMLIFRYTFVIAYGSYLWQCRGKAEGGIAFGWKIASFLAGCVFIIMYAYMGVQSKIVNNDWKDTTYLPCLYIVPLAEFLIQRVHFGFKPLELIGRASFNIFLVQMVYYTYAVNFVRRLIPNHSLCLVLHIVICVSVGLIFYLVEKPITHAVLQVGKKQKK